MRTGSLSKGRVEGAAVEETPGSPDGGASFASADDGGQTTDCAVAAASPEGKGRGALAAGCGALTPLAVTITYTWQAFGNTVEAVAHVASL